MADLPAPRFLDERLAHWASAKPDGEAMDYLDRSWTWSQWNDRVRRLAGALKERGIGRGDVVSFLDKNHPACVELTFAAASLGAATAIINFRLAADELDYVLNDSDAKLLIVGDEFTASIDKIRDKLTHIEHVISVKPEGDDEYEAVLDAATPVDRSDDVDPSDVCIIMYSSGTTGRPKGAMNTHGNVVFTAMVYRDCAMFAPGGSVLAIAPLFHITGLIGHIALSLLAPMPLVLAYRFEPGVMLDTLERHRPTCTIGAITALIGVFITRARAGENPLDSINRGFYISAVISAVLCAGAAYLYLPGTYAELGSSDETGALDAFQTERAGFMINWPYVYAVLAGAEVDWIDDLAWARYPRTVEGEESKPPLGGIELGVNQASQNQEAAWDAAECITSQESQKAYMLGSGNPAARKAVYDDPEVREQFPMADLIRESLDAGAPRPLTQYYGDVSSGIQREYSPPGSVDPDTTPQRTTTLLQDVLNGDALL